MRGLVQPSHLVFLFSIFGLVSLSNAQDRGSLHRQPINVSAANNTSKLEFAHLKPRIEAILKQHFKDKENSAARSPWGIMHAMVAFGPYAEMYGDGKLVKDVDWLCANQPCRKMKLLAQSNGKLRTNNGPGRQGHDGQFLAILAQSQIPKTRTLAVDGIDFTIEDLIQFEMASCKAKEELTFKLIGLSHYIDSDQTWLAADGQVWNLERIVKEELRQPINGVACGGTHRLMGYSYAILMRKLQEKPITGHWKRADDFVNEFREFAFKLQNRDGSFSTNWFKGREMKRDEQRRVQTTGHILEWLVFSADEEGLREKRLVKSVDYLSNLMHSNLRTKWEIGPKGHALRALRLFYEKTFANSTDAASAKNPTKSTDTVSALIQNELKNKLKQPNAIVVSANGANEEPESLAPKASEVVLVDPIAKVAKSSKNLDGKSVEAKVNSINADSKNEATPRTASSADGKRKQKGEPKTADRSNSISADDLPELPLLIR